MVAGIYHLANPISNALLPNNNRPWWLYENIVSSRSLRDPGEGCCSVFSLVSLISFDTKGVTTLPQCFQGNLLHTLAAHIHPSSVPDLHRA